MTVGKRFSAEFRIDEIKHFHPIVAQWLDIHGYAYEHEYRCRGGEIDFFAQHRTDRHYLIVECKPNLCINDGIKKVLKYREGTSVHKAGIAILIGTAKRGQVERCKERDIDLIEIDKPYGYELVPSLNLEMAYLYLYSKGFRYTLNQLKLAAHTRELRTTPGQFSWQPHTVNLEILEAWANSDKKRTEPQTKTLSP